MQIEIKVTEEVLGGREYSPYLDEDGVAVTIRAANGVVNVFDENDYCGKFPFNRPHPEVSTHATPRQ